MYLRSAPLQKMPLVPRTITQRTSAARASCNPAFRKSRAVSTSMELNRSGRSMTRVPTGPSRSIWMCSMAMAALPSADARQQLTLVLREQALAEPGVQHHVADACAHAFADHGGIHAGGVPAQRV